MHPLYKYIWRTYIVFVFVGFFTFITMTFIFIYSHINLNIYSENFLIDLIFTVFIYKIIYLVYFFIIRIVFYIIGNNKYKRFLDDTMYQCKVGKFIEVSEELYKYIEKKPKIFSVRQAKISLISSVVVGYINIGDSQLAKTTLHNIPELKKSEDIFKFHILAYWSAYYINIDDLKNAEKYFAEMTDFFVKPSIPNLCRDIYEITKITLSIAKKDFEGVEDALKNHLEKSKNLLEEVGYVYELGNVYLYENRLDEAKEAFQFVIENGGDTYLVKKSKDFLDIVERKSDEIF